MTANEVTLLEEIRELSYGDVLNVESSSDAPNRAFKVTSKEANFLAVLRGYGHLAKVVVHDREPTAAETPSQTASGLRTIKRFRF